MPQISAVSFSFPLPLEALLVAAEGAVDGLDAAARMGARWRVVEWCEMVVGIKISGMAMVVVAEGEGSRHEAVGSWLEEVVEDLVTESLKFDIGSIEKGERG
jgi:hypothetical protein